MPKKYVSIQQVPLNDCKAFLTPHQVPPIIDEENPAIDALIDFQRKKPLTISEDLRMYDARVKMECSDLPFILALNDNKELMGTLSLDQVLSGKTIELIQKRRVVRKSILVKDVMTPMSRVFGFDFDHIFHVKVGNVIRSINESGQDYALVVEMDKETQTQTVRGVFLASLISKQIGRNIVQKDNEPVSSVLELMESIRD